MMSIKNEVTGTAVLGILNLKVYTSYITSANKFSCVKKLTEC